MNTQQRLNIFAGCALAICCTAASHAAVIAMDIPDLTAESDRVIIGDVIETNVYVVPETGVYMTDVVIAVSDNLKGDGPQRIETTFYGGVIGNEGMTVSTQPIFATEDHVLLFMNHKDQLTGAFQGAYLTDGVEAVQMAGGRIRWASYTLQRFDELLDEIAAALPAGDFPQQIAEYNGDFILPTNQTQFVLLNDNWSYMSNPMGETYRVNGNCSDSVLHVGDSQDQVDALSAGADVWTNSGALFEFPFCCTTTSQVISNNSLNIVYFDQSGFLGDETLAATFRFFSGNNTTGWDIAFNDPDTQWYLGASPCGGIRFDIQSTAAHEFGHALGLDHTPIFAATMFFSGAPCDLSTRSLHPDDIDGAIFIYGENTAENGTKPIPFLEPFDDNPYDTTNWTGEDGLPVVNNQGNGEISPPNSLRLAGNSVSGGDQIRSAIFNNAGSFAALELSYWWQRTGFGNSPEAGEDLFVEYLDSGDDWQLLAQYPGDGSDADPYQQEVINLPAGALHNGLRIRFRCVSTLDGTDNWFIDDVLLQEPVTKTLCPGNANEDDAVDVFDMLDVLDAWGVCPDPCPDFCGPDVNEDCSIDVFDLLDVLDNFGPCP